MSVFEAAFSPLTFSRSRSFIQIFLLLSVSIDCAILVSFNPIVFVFFAFCFVFLGALREKKTHKN